MQELAIPCRQCGAWHTFHEDCVDRDEPEHTGEDSECCGEPVRELDGISYCTYCKLPLEDEA